MTVQIRLGSTPSATRLATLAALALAAGGCRQAEAPEAVNELNSAVEANLLLQAAEENAAALTEDENLANQAAADEAADMDVFGGNAAAGETPGSPPDPVADGNSGR